MDGIYNGGTPTTASNKKHFQEVAIYRTTKNFFSLQVLQFVSVVRKCLRNIEGVDPQGLKFGMLSFVLLGCIPF
jgi:hypothetical protein